MTVSMVTQQHNCIRTGGGQLEQESSFVAKSIVICRNKRSHYKKDIVVTIKSLLLAC